MTAMNFHYGASLLALNHAYESAVGMGRFTGKNVRTIPASFSAPASVCVFRNGVFCIVQDQFQASLINTLLCSSLTLRTFTLNVDDKPQLM